MIFLCETLHSEGKAICLDMYDIVEQSPMDLGRGMIAYNKNSSRISVKSKSKEIIYYDKSKYCEAIIVNIVLANLDITIIMLYKSPNCCKNVIKIIIEKLKSKFENNVILFGDFNINNLDKSEKICLLKMLEEYKLCLNSPAQSSTNLGNQLDLCFSNINNVNVLYFENLFSYHKAVNITLNI
jgi:hypothetical protein